jgi:hypothetical protein
VHEHAGVVDLAEQRLLGEEVGVDEAALTVLERATRMMLRERFVVGREVGVVILYRPEGLVVQRGCFGDHGFDRFGPHEVAHPEAAGVEHRLTCLGDKFCACGITDGVDRVAVKIEDLVQVDLGGGKGGGLHPLDLV